MNNYFKNKKLIQELNSLWIKDKKTKKDIINVFSWIITWKETLDEIEKNKKKIFNTIMQEDSIIKNYFIDNIWLSDETILVLNEYLSKIQFLDIKSLFENLRMFFFQKFQSIDVVFYRLNQSKNVLEFFSWRDNYWWNILIEDTINNDYINELTSLKSEKEKFIMTSWILDVNYWWIWSIKIKSLKETYIMSFYQKNYLTNIWDDDFKNDILKIKKLFDVYWLLQILKLYIKNINEVYKDELTWLFNEKYINSLSSHVKYSVIFIDLNNFKKINDTYWHKSWDEVLIKFSNILRDSVRSIDKVCRIHWDEFLILVPSNDKKELEHIKSRIEMNLSKYVFSFQNIFTSNIDKFSISRAVWYQLAESWQTLSEIIHKADMKMYNQKFLK